LYEYTATPLAPTNITAKVIIDILSLLGFKIVTLIFSKKTNSFFFLGASWGDALNADAAFAMCVGFALGFEALEVNVLGAGFRIRFAGAFGAVFEISFMHLS
jgi:hypothetical protein